MRNYSYEEKKTLNQKMLSSLENHVSRGKDYSPPIGKLSQTASEYRTTSQEYLARAKATNSVHKQHSLLKHGITAHLRVKGMVLTARGGAE